MSQAGIKPKNHIHQIRTRRSNLGLFGDPTDGVDDRHTPRSLFDPLHDRFRFTLDAAASVENALLPRYFTRWSDGLSLSWWDDRVWCNPPYSAIGDWVHKADGEIRGGRCPLAVLLLPADRTEQPWWQQYIEPHRDGRGDALIRTEFIAKRVKFGLPPGHPDGDKGLAQGKKGGGYRYPPFGCVLVIFERGG
jgi:phage N-6-adenine-methyltransferase